MSREIRKEMIITAITLQRKDEYAVVSIEIDGRTIEVLRELLSNDFNHTVYPQNLLNWLPDSSKNDIGTFDRMRPEQREGEWPEYQVWCVAILEPCIECDTLTRWRWFDGDAVCSLKCKASGYRRVG